MPNARVKEWIKSGVAVGNDIDPSRISDQAILLPGSRIRGTKTSIGPGCIVGEEGPVTIDNCQLGRSVKLKGGYFAGATFFDGANMGSGAHVRPGCILEEEASGAHSVGLKQTVFLPYMTAGSLINFCDALMAGGTSRKDHSEIGSSYVHFNFTPHQDKATASLIGDVPNGVFMDQKPVFLGGQGGLAGPVRIAYGTVIAAGGVCRQDIIEPDQLHVAPSPELGSKPYQSGVYRNIDRIVRNNLIYIGNIEALREWYSNVRAVFVRDKFDQACLDGGIMNLNLILAERIRRMAQLADKMEYSVAQLKGSTGASSGMIEVQERFKTLWPEMERNLCCNDRAPSEQFTEAIKQKNDGSYIDTIKALDAETRETGRAWLQSIVDSAEQLWS
jgi:UDP-N-acetylglucosamine/UDP-N-acetylgalactosamine diphosphorylase